MQDMKFNKDTKKSTIVSENDNSINNANMINVNGSIKNIDVSLNNSKENTAEKKVPSIKAIDQVSLKESFTFSSLVNTSAL